MKPESYERAAAFLRLAASEAARVLSSGETSAALVAQAACASAWARVPLTPEDVAIVHAVATADASEADMHGLTLARDIPRRYLCGASRAEATLASVGATT